MTAGAEMQHAAVSGGRNISTSSAAETAAAYNLPRFNSASISGSRTSAQAPLSSNA